MIDELCDLLRREVDATTALEGRLRSLELVVAAEEDRFLALALDEVEAVSEHLAGLELTRVLALTTAGLSPDVAARELIEAAADDDAARRLATVVRELDAATVRLVDARARAQTVVASGSQRSRQRLQAVNEFARH